MNSITECSLLSQQQHLYNQLLTKSSCSNLTCTSENCYWLNYTTNVPVLLTSIIIELRYCCSHIIAVVFVLHHPVLSDGCPCTMWISNILSRPVADLVYLGDHISSCSSDPSVDQLAVQLVTPHQLSTFTSAPQLLDLKSLQFNICCAMPSDVYNPLWLCSIPLQLICCFAAQACLVWVLAVVSDLINLLQAWCHCEIHLWLHCLKKASDNTA